LRARAIVSPASPTGPAPSADCRCSPQSLASFECDLQAEYEFGSYDILTGMVRSVATRAAARPLLYFDGGFRGLAENER